MSIKYRLQEIKDSINPEGKKKTGYYPKVIRVRTVKMRNLAQETARRTTLSPAEVEFALSLLLERIEEELLSSNHVCLDGFGTFSLTAESRAIENPDEIRAESIHVKRVVFTPSRTLIKRIKNARFVREKVKP